MFSSSRKFGVAEAFGKAVTIQSLVINAVKASSCPNCGGKSPLGLHLVAYENSYDQSHYEAAVVCATCNIKFVFTEKGLKGAYPFKSDESIGKEQSKNESK